MSKPRFLHIALEGIDGCGKSTQVVLLHNHLEMRDFDVAYIKEPGDGELGCMIRDELHKRSITDMELNVLFAADRIVQRMQMRGHNEHMELVGEVSDTQRVYVGDRSVWSAYAYHGNKHTMHQYLSPNTVRPDLTLVLDLDVDEAIPRLHGKPPDRFENRIKMSQARLRYQELAIDHPDIVRLVNGVGTVYQVAHRVCEAVDAWLDDR